MLLSTLHKTGARIASRSAVSRVVARGFAKDIKFGVDGRNAMLAGVNTLADAVQVCAVCSIRHVNLKNEMVDDCIELRREGEQWVLRLSICFIS